MILDNVKFREDYEEISVKLFENHYSDLGISDSDLSLLIGIEESIIIRYDDWYKLDDGFYFYKEHGIFEELFLSELAKECKVRCVEFRLAYETFREHSVKCLGVISKLYRMNGKQYYYYGDFCKKYFGRIKKDLSFFKLSSSEKFGENKTNQLMDDVFSLLSFDMFTGQYDRMEHNFFFECGEDSIRIAPLCDNGACFSAGFIYCSPFGQFPLSHIDDDNIHRKKFLNLLKDEIIFYEKMLFLLDINIKDVLDKTIYKYRIVMKDSEQNRVLSYFDDRKKAIEHTLKLSMSNR